VATGGNGSKGGGSTGWQGVARWSHHVVVILVKVLEELAHAVGRQGHSHDAQRRAELADVQLAVAVDVKLDEDTQHVLGLQVRARAD
jgi:hypothetical protein